MKPADAARFHLIVLLGIIAALGIALTTVDPNQDHRVLDRALGRSAAADLFPDSGRANDRKFLGDKVNKRWVNALAMPFLGLLVVIAVVTIPLMIVTKAGG